MEKPRIVIVDDNESLLKVLVEFFELQEFNAIGLTSISRINQLVELEPDLVILDYNMPLLNGDQIAELMKESDRLSATPIIMISALLPKNANILGVAAVLHKPLDLNSLCECVARLLKLNECLFSHT